MTSTTSYIHYPDRPNKLTAGFASKRYAELISKIDDAEKKVDVTGWEALFLEWNELKSYIGSEGARIHHQFNKDMNDPSLEAADKYFREKIEPVSLEGEHALTTALLASRHQKALAKRFGEQLLVDYQTQIKALDPVNKDIRVKAGELSTRYEKRVASALIRVNGEEMNLWKARSLSFSEKEDVRRASYVARGDWFLEHHDELAEIYDQLVKLRHQMGKNVGYGSFIPLAYERMGRSDYGPSDVAAFRDSVLESLTPLWQAHSRKSAAALGSRRLKAWDLMYNPHYTLPLGCAPLPTQLDGAGRLFERLSPRLAAHYEKMRKGGLIDLESRPGKRSGAYCTHFPDEQKVAILLNSTGDADDISTLTHEMGHAFQGWESMHIEAVDLQSPTYDLCEVHSMGMEFLSLPFLTEFFTAEQANKFAKNRWYEAVYTLCYICVVDEFQHWVFENVDSTPKQRDDKWQELSEKYLPEVDFTGVEKYRATRWYAQAHIFSVPFYYIDYALAEVGAMQLAARAGQDQPGALETYIALCELGGTKSLLDAFASAGLSSPFQADTVRGVAEYAARELDG